MFIEGFKVMNARVFIRPIGGKSETFITATLKATKDANIGCTGPVYTICIQNTKEVTFW